MRTMKKEDAVKQLRYHGLIHPDLSPSFTLPNMNRIIFHGNSKNETTKTYLVKCLIGKIIHDKGEHFISEFEIRQRKIDIFHIKPNFEYVKYEIATSPSKEAMKLKDDRIPGSEVIIDLRKVPNDVEKAEKYLKEVVI